MCRLLPLLCCVAFAGCIEYLPELPDLGPIADRDPPDTTPDLSRPEPLLEMGIPEAGMPEVGMPPDTGTPLDMCTPGDEICDAVDDDCDGRVDEDLPGCDAGCDAIDDDDDGRTDEGCASVTCDGLGALPPCNGAADGLEIPSGWVYIPSGEMLLGTPEAEDTAVDEMPQQPARISRGFLMMRTELTQGLWRSLADGDPAVEGSPSYFDGVDGRICDRDAPDACPVERISWIDAAWAANALSRRHDVEPCYDPDTLETFSACNGPVGSGCAAGDDTCGPGGCDPDRLDTLRDVGGCLGYRLPTSTEWVHAARAGAVTRFWSGEDAAGLRAAEWFEDNADGHSHRVGQPPGPDTASHRWGLSDMHGNVAELVHEAYGPLPAPPPDGGLLDPLLLSRGGDSRQIRGCSWAAVGAASCRATIRAPIGASDRDWGVGARFVHPLAPPPADPPRVITLEALGGAVVRSDTPLTLEAQAVGGRGVLTGTLYLISPQDGTRSRSQAVGQFVAAGQDRWRLTVEWPVINALGAATFEPDGVRRRVAARFADADGRADVAYLWLDFQCVARGEPTSACGGVCQDRPGEACEVGCDAIDDDGDGRSDEGCDAVMCGAPPDEPVPPCNGAPEGTEIPSGWVYVRPGRFRLGSSEDPGRQDWLEAPQQWVTIDRALLMMRTEITQAEWRTVAGDAAGDPSYFGGIDGPACDGATGDDCPVERISWLDAVWYANARSVAVGRTPCYDPARVAALEACNTGWGSGCTPGETFCHPSIVVCDLDDLAALHAMPACDGFRLPTDAEWEYAARAGAEGLRWSDDLLAEVAWVADPDGMTHPVGRPPDDAGDAHPWGLYDVYGNVWEWTHEHFGPWPAPPPAVEMRDPLALPAARPYHGLRGCSFASPDYLCRSAQRFRDGPTARRVDWGARLVRELDPPAARPGPTLAPLAVGSPLPLPDLAEEPLVLPQAALVLVARPSGGVEPLTGVLYLLGEQDQPAIAVDDFVDGGDGTWRATVDWAELNTLRPVTTGRDGILRRLVARFADETGRGALAHLDVRFACAVDDQLTGACLGECLPVAGVECDRGCDRSDTDGDGRSDEWCPAVTCGSLLDDMGAPVPVVPPCNDCPEGTVIPEGWACAPAGDFVMGSPPDEPGRGGGDEDQVAVRLTTPFLVSKTEVTQAEWQAVFGNNPSSHQPCPVDPPADPGECPVEQVTWYEALAYANALTDAMAGLERCYALAGCDVAPGDGMVCDPEVVRVEGCTGFRLPSEAEWEYAARAGTVTAYWGGPGEIDLTTSDWYASNSARHPEAVCSLAASPWGLCDVHGNVHEWVEDHFDVYADPERGLPLIDPRGGLNGPNRVHRGGTYGTNAAACRSACRARSLPQALSLQRGFRLVRGLPPRIPD